MKRRRPARVVMSIVTVILFLGLLYWLTVSAQAAECHACVAYNGQQNCATASAASADEAERQARNTACGTIAHGMNESIACTNTPPVSKQCRQK
jgi:hypothetical protein